MARTARSITKWRRLSVSDEIEMTLAERGRTYGIFVRQASIAHDLKAVMRQYCNLEEHLAPDQQECLEIMAVKMARILNGDPNYRDNWLDLSAYPRLVADRLKGSDE